jgi:hypothetical protein
MVVAKAQDKGPLKMCLRLLPIGSVVTRVPRSRLLVVGIGGITGWETSWGSASLLLSL